MALSEVIDGDSNLLKDSLRRGLSNMCSVPKIDSMYVDTAAVTNLKLILEYITTGMLSVCFPRASLDCL